MKQPDLYARLELLSPEAQFPAEVPRSHAARVRRNTWAQLRKKGISLLNYFCGSTDPRISVEQTRHRVSRYRVFDPVTQQHLSFGSEPELRVWLDQRYYQ